MECPNCKKEVVNDIKNFYGLLICGKCRDEELELIRKDREAWAEMDDD